jgi:hypothetical protein
METQDFLKLETNFNLLSLQDLLAARELFHLHLSHKPNVVATAIGRYRIRKTDPWPDEDNPMERHSPASRMHKVRTLENSEIRPYSWPAILVFVEKWVEVKEFSNPEDAIPPAVYMPNGQKVPLCVIQVEKDDIIREGSGHYKYPANMMGGGYPVFCEIQGQEHYGSVGCLVSNGHKIFALTNRHVAGEAGSPIGAIIGNNKQQIGTTSSFTINRKLFEEIYPGWHGSHVYVDMDVGLIDIENLQNWTTQVYGIGEIGPLADVDMSNISLRLIGCPVRAYGAASGDMRGEICALFYRFNSVGGFDYIADILIGPREKKSLGTHPGDSGTLWLIDTHCLYQKGPYLDQKEPLPRPLALQWGGQVFLDKNKKGSSYALATFLSTICNELDVTLVRDWNIGLPNYWGAVGHYSIANKACGVIQNRKLKRLMQANLERISFELPDINKKALSGLSKRDFVPLADVPDMVWKIGPFRRGGAKAPEHANHFADMDRKLDPPLSEGATLLEICKNNPQNVSIEIWQKYYDAVEQQFPSEEENRGLLPFRVWQIYDTMVSAVRDGKVEEFVCAAGILAHYVGDACQPLHISYLFNGDPDQTVRGTIRNRETGKKSIGQVPIGQGVHSSYEENMISRHVPELIQGIDTQLSRQTLPSNITGGHAAAVRVIELMQKTFDTLLPHDIIEEYLKTQDEKPAARADAMWETLGEETINVMAEGCLCLAHLWNSAWEEGNGDSTIGSLSAIDEEVLADLYKDRDFLPSRTLKTIGPLLQSTAKVPSTER